MLMMLLDCNIKHINVKAKLDWRLDMGQKMDFIAKTLNNAKLNNAEKLGVLQFFKIIDDSILPIKNNIIYEGLKKINKMFESNKFKGFEKEFIEVVNESYLELRKILGSEVINKISINEEDEKGTKVEKGENESESDFQKRKKETEAEQSKKEEEFAAKSAGKKKGEQKPLAKSLRAKGMSQNDLADTLNVDKSTISRLKTGVRKPSYELMTQLADQFGSITNIFPELG